MTLGELSPHQDLQTAQLQCGGDTGFLGVVFVVQSQPVGKSTHVRLNFTWPVFHLVREAQPPALCGDAIISRDLDISY